MRAALLSGADRDDCYMLRAHAYLLNENLDGSKRDLSAILRSDPEHKSAKALHRQLKKFGKALDEAERLRTSRSWAELRGDLASDDGNEVQAQVESLASFAGAVCEAMCKTVQSSAFR